MGNVDEQARFHRMERVSVLYAEITAATCEFLRAVAECDRHPGLVRGGLRLLCRLAGLARRRGARDGEGEGPRCACARGAAADLGGDGPMRRAGERTAERVRHQLRRFSVHPDGNGMYEVHGRLTPEVAAVLMRAVEAAGDVLYRQGAGADGPGPEDGPPSEPEQLRADATHRLRRRVPRLLAEQALAAGFVVDDVPVCGTRAERYQVVLHVEAETLDQAEEPGMSELDGGRRVSAETSRRLACGASRVVVRKRGDGSILDVGRRTRTIPPALRRALEIRDRGCRFPGCGLRFTDGHHIEHWADGGRADLKNTVLLCRRHHRLVHEEGHRIALDELGQVVFFTPGGKAIAAAPPPTTPDAAAVDELIHRNRRRGVEPAWNTIMPRYHRQGGVP